MMNEIEILSNKFNINSKLIELLISRGIDSEDSLYKFLNPSIDNLCPIEKYEGAIKVAKRIEQAIINDEKILIFGDYDCDGIVSVSMLYLYLKSRGVNVYNYIPNRHSDGYGINIDSVIAIREKYNPNIIITVDCGISNEVEINYIKNNLGIEVIVTDHHIPPSKLPDCLIFNPKIERQEVYKELSGAGVVLRLIEALSGKEEMLKFIDLACLATIADIVPLTDDNRVIVSLGLKALKANPRKGVDLLAKRTKASFISSDIAFKIVPAINASGRLDDANKVLDLFISNDYFILTSIVREICNDNSVRKQLTQIIYNDALDMLDDYDLINKNIIMLYKDNWDIGILGIAAAKLARQFNRPVILMTITDDCLKGSGRSVKGIDLYSVLNKYNDKYISFGGHSQAIGIKFYKNDYCELLELFSNDLENDTIDNSERDIYLDDANNYKLFKDLERLEPFGNSNEKPQFEIKNIFKFNPINNTRHIKANVADNIEIVGFGMIDIMALLNSEIESSFIVDMNINNYNRYGQYIINDIKNTTFRDDRDYTNAKYLKQLLYKYSEIEYKIVTLEQLSGILDKEYGNLLIASDINTCYNVLNRYNNLEFYIEKKKLLNPNNAIVLAPSSSNISRYYERLIFLDMPKNNGYVKLFAHKGIKEVLIVDNDYLVEDCIFDMLKANRIIDCLIDLSVKYRLKSLDEAYYRVKNIIECSYLEFCLIFYILYEMKIIRVIKHQSISLRKIDDRSRKKILRRLDGNRAF